MFDAILRLGLLDEAEIELDKAALEIAGLDHVESDPSYYLDLLDQMAGRLRVISPADPTAEQQAAALAQVLAGEFRFEGDRETYDDPSNADLFRVIDRRRGLPVALAILYVALARRLGWVAHVLNVPSHVLVGIGDNPILLIDPFMSGAIVHPEQVAALLRSMSAVSRAVGPIITLSNRAVLVRLLMNQASRAEQAQKIGRALTVMERITTVAPGYSEGWWERARLELSRGNASSARECLGSMLETTRDPDLRSRVNRALNAIAG